MSANKKLSPIRICGRLLLCLSLGILFSSAPAALRADTLEDAARALARKVSSSARGLSATLELQNNSSLNGAPLTSFSSVFEQELQRSGIKVLTGKAEAAVILTLSQNLMGYLAVAQVLRGDSSDTVMELLQLPEGAFAFESSKTYALRKQLLFAQASPILDVVLSRDARQADILGPRDISHYRMQGDQWVFAGVERLPVLQASGREWNGVLFQGVDSWAAYLPGELCRFSSLDTKGWSCEKYRDHVPVRTVSPDLLNQKKVASWTSAAQFGSDANPQVIVMGQDGLARLFEEGPDPVATFTGWGSQIASLHSGCGSGWQLLIAGSGDWSAPDKIQAVEIRDRNAQVVASPLEFPGPVISLQTPKARTPEDASANTSAVAAVHNLQTGQYEAYLLTMACAN